MNSTTNSTNNTPSVTNTPNNSIINIYTTRYNIIDQIREQLGIPEDELESELEPIRSMVNEMTNDEIIEIRIGINGITYNWSIIEDQYEIIQNNNEIQNNEIQNNNETRQLRRVIRRSINETKKKKTKKEIKEIIKKNIPKHEVLNKKSKIIKENTDCIICTNEYKTREWITKLECNHIFHKKCIDKWFTTSREMKCPYCRKDFEKIV